LVDTLTTTKQYGESTTLVCRTAISNTSQASGVGVNSKCLEEYQDLKLRKKYKYIIFTLSNDYKEIVVKKTSESTDYDEFITDLPETECTWAIYDFEFEKEEGGKRNKICFFSW
jgi:cofilin